MAHLRGGRGSVAIGYGRVGNYVKVHPLALFPPNDPEQSPSAKKQVRSRKELSGRFVGFDDHTGLVDNGKTPVYLGKSCGVVLANLSTAAILAYLTSRNRQGILGSLVSGVRQLPPTFTGRSESLRMGRTETSQRMFTVISTGVDGSVDNCAGGRICVGTN